MNKVEIEYPVVLASTEQSKPYNVSFNQMPMKHYIYQKYHHYNPVWYPRLEKYFSVMHIMQCHMKYKLKPKVVGGLCTVYMRVTLISSRFLIQFQVFTQN